MSSIGVRRVGERGVLLELAENDEVLRVAGGLRSQLAGAQVEDVVPGHRTLLVTWRGVLAEERLLAAAEAALGGAALTEPHELELAVRYDGPDLGEVARLAGLSPEEVVARHVRPTYTVGFLGFAPGFAYLLGGDEALLDVPRLDVPRERVPGGSVALAGPYSGVYPRESPGGWRLIGGTDATLFDPARSRPALLAAGDRVRFVASR